MFEKRSKILILIFLSCFFVVILRLFYWQVIKSSEFKLKALMQTYKLEKIFPKRGRIFSSDNFPLALNQTNYQISVYKPNLKDNLDNIFSKIDSIKPDFIKNNSSLIDNFKNNSNQKWLTFPTKFNSTEIEKNKFSRSHQSANQRPFLF